MAIVSSNYHIRSKSLPSRTHPTTLTVEDELKRLKSWEEASSSTDTNAGSICYSLTGLQELYQCIDDLLNLPSTINAFSRQQNRIWVNELLDISVRILDICGVAKDMVSKCKENVRDLQSTLRRRKGSNSILESNINKYFSNRSQLKKDAKRSLKGLQQIDQEINGSATLVMVNIDGQVISVIRVLQEVNTKSISIFQTVLKFLSVKSYKQKIKKWKMVTRLVQKEKLGSEEQQMKSSNEIENADVALRCLCENDQIDMGRVLIVQNKLQILEGSLEGMENQLDSMFRCLIKSRTTILNVFSC